MLAKAANKVCYLFMLAMAANLVYADTDFEDGITAGKAASINLPKVDAAMVDLSPHLIEVSQEPTASNKFSAKSAQDIIANSQSKGQAVTDSLRADAANVVQEGKTIDAAAQLSFKHKADAELTNAEAMQKSIVSQEVIRMQNDQGEVYPAFKELLSIERGEREPEVSINAEHEKTLQQEYEEVYEDVAEQEPYELTCSQSLMDPIRMLDEVLVINTSEQPDQVIEKRIRATFSSNTYSNNHFVINFKNKTIKEVGGNGGTHFEITDSLGDEFGVNTEVTLVSESHNSGVNLPIGNVSWSECKLTQQPNYANGFVANFTVRQPATDGRHGKKRRNQYRGGELVYSFKDKKPVPPKFESEYWQKGAQSDLYQDLVDLGFCHIVSQNCIEGSSKKIFGNKPPYLTLTRDCWKKQITYRCDIPQGANDCGSIPGNCVENSTQYIEFLDEPAVAVKSFSCLRTVSKRVRNVIAHSEQIKPPGDYQKNDDLKDALIGLNFAKEMKDGFRNELSSNGGIFFAGDGKVCNLTKGCCANKNSGWSRVFHCTDDEKKLAERVKAKACTMIGEFKPTKGALRKIKTIKKVGYCCYGSPIARIIQDGATKQLGISRGKPKEPNCRSLTMDELEQLQFDRPEFDFSDLINDLTAKAKLTNLGSERAIAIEQQIKQGLAVDLSQKTAPGVEVTSNKSSLAIIDDSGATNVSQAQLAAQQQAIIDQAINNKKSEPGK